jgi:tetratricopeptide (TPR) repeat protein
MFSPPTLQSTQQHVNLLKHIPQSVAGSILVTSRNTGSAIKMVGDRKAIIPINSMDPSDALSLLNNKLTDKQRPVRDCLALAAALDYIPLAITQATAYISKGAPRMNVSRYLDPFNESEGNRSSLLDEDSGDLRRDPDVPNAIITTWQITFSHIKTDHPSAADLLSLMSVLNRQGIPEFLLLEENSDRHSIEAALALLLGYSFIITESGGNSFEMHRLVQLATKKWLEVHGMIGKWNQQALRLLSNTFPNGDCLNWKLCESLLPHIEAVLSFSFQGRVDLQKASILYNYSWYLWRKGNYQLSKSKIEQSLEIRKSYLDKKDEILLRTFALYGTVLIANGQYDEAEAIQRHVVQFYKEVVGQKHPDTLESMNNLAEVLESQGKYDEAEAMHREALQLKEEVLGQKHPSTLTSMNNLANVLRGQGKNEEVEAMYREVVQLNEEVLSQSTLTRSRV